MTTPPHPFWEADEIPEDEEEDEKEELCLPAI